jgi:hypothetical protein
MFQLMGIQMFGKLGLLNLYSMVKLNCDTTR